jgi:hypothetical protein
VRLLRGAAVVVGVWYVMFWAEVTLAIVAGANEKGARHG